MAEDRKPLVVIHVLKKGVTWQPETDVFLHKDVRPDELVIVETWEGGRETVATLFIQNGRWVHKTWPRGSR